MPPTTTADFGRNFAVLNVDWMSILIEAIQDTTEGKSFIENISRWNNVVHQKEMRPLTLFSTLALKFGQPELEANTPFSDLIAPFGTFEEGSPEVQIDPQFLVDEKDVIIHKTRWSATTGNSLEQILKANKIDTVVVSGLSLSGAVMSTIYRLFDMDYRIYVIADAVIELPADQTAEVSKVMLGMLLPKMNLRVISLEEAIQALERA